MKRTIFIYGGVSGAVIIGSMIMSLSLAGEDSGLAGAESFGYLIMIVSLSVIFFGIKQYRDRDLGGVIRFGTGVKMGLGITVVASLVYVATWEVNLFMTDYAFINDYTESILASAEASGATEAELEAERAAMAELREQYGNPLFRLPMTFLEIFPVGLVITLVAAAVLRNSEFLPARA